MSSVSRGHSINEIAGCEEIRPLLSAYVDDEVTAAEAERVRTHLDACISCASDLAFLNSLAVAARRLPSAAPSPELFARIAQATYARPTVRERILTWLAPSPTRWGVAGGLVAASLAMFLAVRTGTYRDVAPVIQASPSAVTATPEIANAAKPSSNVARKSAPATPAALASPIAPVIASGPVSKAPAAGAKETERATTMTPDAERNRIAKATANPEATKPTTPTATPNPRVIAEVTPPRTTPTTAPVKPRPGDTFAPKTSGEPVTIASNGGERVSASPTAAPRSMPTPDPEPHVATAVVPAVAPAPAEATEPRGRLLVSLKDTNLKSGDRPDITANRDARSPGKAGVLVEAPVK